MIIYYVYRDTDNILSYVKGGRRMKDVYTEKFKEKYFRFAAIMDSDLWEKVLYVIDDEDLVKNFVFANDVLKIPPVKTFIMYFELQEFEFENTMKQNLGAAFGCLFYDLLGYADKTSVSCRIANVKMASLFLKE